MKGQKYNQQGDVLLFKEDEIPEGMEVLETSIIREGEATGHAHRLHGDGFQLYGKKDDGRPEYLRVVKPVELRHEEHAKHTVEPGIYKIGVVKEYDHLSEEAREVAD